MLVANFINLLVNTLLGITGGSHFGRLLLEELTEK
jgi:hypothetical protein